MLERKEFINKILNGDAMQHLKQMPSESVNCVMTSPPYWALRDYGIEGQLGLESTFEEYINKLCDIFDQVKRVLRKDGTCWVNIGDTYFGSGKGAGGDIEGSKQVWAFENKTKKICEYCGKEFDGYAFQQFCSPACSGVDNTPRTMKGKMPDKTLTMIPFRFSIEMVNRGWILRNTIIWHKPNCMPSSVKDRFTVDFEYIFFFVKNKKYWFETQYDKHSQIDRRGNNRVQYDGKWGETQWGNYLGQGTEGKNKRTVWKITTQPFPEAHFAVYPEAICKTPIKAGCPEFVCNKCGTAREKVFNTLNPGNYKDDSDYKRQIDTKHKLEKFNRNSHKMEVTEKEYNGLSNCNCNSGFHGGIVLDPFFGAGTTGVVALKQNKQFIGIELNKEYIEIANKRLKPYLEQEKLGL